MSNRTIAFLAGVALLAAFVVLAYRFAGPVPATPEPAPVLRTYQVPAGFEDEARAMLRSALVIGDKWQGAVSVGPSGSVLVTAPPAIQTGVQAFVEQLGKTTPEKRTPQAVAIDYWILVGRRAGAGRSAPNVPRREGTNFAVLGNDTLTALDPALTQVGAKQGPTEFALFEHLRITSVGDEFASTGGLRSSVRQRAAMSASDVVAELQISLPRTNHSLMTRVVLKRGQLLVLAESGFQGDPPAAFAGVGRDDLTLYYVVAADLPA
jgi:hypothetical protein